MADERTHVVREQAVEADVTEAQLVTAAAQLTLPVGAQGHGGVVAPDRVLPEMRERGGRLRQITIEVDNAHASYPFRQNAEPRPANNALYNIFKVLRRGLALTRNPHLWSADLSRCRLKNSRSQENQPRKVFVRWLQLIDEFFPIDDELPFARVIDQPTPA